VLCSTKDPGQKPFTFKAGVGQVIAGDVTHHMLCFSAFIIYLVLRASGLEIERSKVQSLPHNVLA